MWFVERAIFILSLVQFDGQLRRNSFGRWLIPKVIRDVLRLDRIAGFKSGDLDALVRSNDPIIVAWRDEKSADLDDWAGALATRANCAKSSVYAQRKKVLQGHKIDIALPFAFYRDLVFFGPNSVTKPQDRAALNAALARDDAATNLRLRQKAAAEFDRHPRGRRSGHCRPAVDRQAPRSTRPPLRKQSWSSPRRLAQAQRDRAQGDRGSIEGRASPAPEDFAGDGPQRHGRRRPPSCGGKQGA